VSLPLAAPLAVTAGVGYTIAIDYMRYYVKTAQYLVQPLTRGAVTLARNGGVYGVIVGQMPAVGSAESASYWIDGKLQRIAVRLLTYVQQALPDAFFFLCMI
jgi:hypothetical protein